MILLPIIRSASPICYNSGMNQRGFTVIELFSLTLLLLVIGVVFWTQKNNIEVASRDEKRKISINAMYYSLEEVFYKTNGYYPKTLTEDTLPSVDDALLKDPNGIMIGKADSSYRYESKRCIAEKCEGYTIRAELENEADYVKQSRN
jgi:Tfp pilus assembly protein PilE